MNNLFISHGLFSSVVKSLTTSLMLVLTFFTVTSLISSKLSHAQSLDNGNTDGYEISFSRVKHPSIEEGSSTLFFFTTSPGLPAWSTLEVDIEVFDGDDDFLDELNWDRRGSTSFYNGGGSATLLFRGSRRDVRNGYSTARLRVLTEDDDVDEPNGTFTVSVTDGPGYWANPNKREKSVIVRDNDEDVPIFVSVTRNIDNGNFVPGGNESPDNTAGNIYFHVCAMQNGKPMQDSRIPKDFEVNFRVNGNQNLISDATVMHASYYGIAMSKEGEMSGILALSGATNTKIAISTNAMPGWSPKTIRDSIGITILPGKGYKVGPTGLCPSGESYERITKYDHDMPWVGVMPGAKYVVEGQPAPFGIGGTIPEGTTVNFEIITGMNFIARKQDFVEIPGNVIPSLLNSVQGSVKYTERGRYINHRLEVQTDDDSVLENDELITVRILPGEGYYVYDYSHGIQHNTLGLEYASVMVIDNDESASETQKAIANYIIASVPPVMSYYGANSQAAFAMRMDAGRGPTNSFELGGQSALNDIIQNSGKQTNNGSLSSVFGNSAFSLTLLEESGTPVSVWGLGNSQAVSSTAADQGQWDGDDFTTQFGIDTWLSDESIIGVSASFYERNIEHEQFDHVMQMTTLNPYYGWTSEDHDLSLLMFGSIGTGEITFDHRFGSESAETSLLMTSIEGRKGLYSGDHTEIELTGDALLANLNITENGGLINNMSIHTHQVTAAFTGSQYYHLANGLLQPSISLGIRSDGGDLEDWTGTNFNTGIAYSTNDLSIAGESGVQMSWDQQLDWGLNTTLDYDANQDNQAVQLSFASNIGQVTNGNLNTIQDYQFAGLTDNTSDYNTPHWKTEVGFGFKIIDQTGILTPFTGIDFSGLSNYDVSMGSRVAIGSNFNFELEGVHKQDIKVGSSNELFLKANTSW